MRNTAAKSIWLWIALLSGCTLVGPDYTPPDTGMPAAWRTAPFSASDPLLLQTWWSVFQDPVLDDLIRRALSGNRDLEAARARVREARARRNGAAAKGFPTLDLSASARSSRGSRRLGGSGDRSELYTAGFDAAWELDIFGGVRRRVAAAEADLEAVREQLRDVQVSLLAEVGINYLESRTFQRRIILAEANLAAQSDTFDLVRAKFRAGLSDELAVEQARYNLESTRAQIPALKAGLDAAQNRLAVLLGRAPGAVHQVIARPRAIPLPADGIAVGVPADLLRRRPDIRRAERELAAQTERVGAATAELYPKLSLSGSIGVDALTVGGLFNTDAARDGFWARLSWPVFDAGAVRAGIAVQSALQEQALMQYDTTVLTALEEVENALTAYIQEQTRRGALTRAAEAARKAAELAETKYTAGLIDFNAVLDAQRSLLSLEDQSARSAGNIVTDLVRLYKALGGGWTPSDITATRCAPSATGDD